jgi:ubiquinone/menaquinone biosynthesis C-methylase UbiE
MPSQDAIRSAQAYWDLAANTYEQDFSGTVIGQTRRAAVRRELIRIFHPGQRVLEINCGTGSDAVFLAQRGIRVLACDIAPRMIELARERVAAASLDASVSLRVLPTEELAALSDEPLFDGAFSNFSGLNCVEDLSTVATDLSHLVKPGSRVLLCIMGRFVPWEILWFLAHRDPKKAFRRFQSSSTFSLEGGPLTVQRPSVNELVRLFAPAFRLRRWKGVGITVPPTFLEKWAGRVPRVVQSLAGLDRALERIPGLRSMADCAVIELERQHTVGAAV